MQRILFNNRKQEKVFKGIEESTQGAWGKMKKNKKKIEKIVQQGWECPKCGRVWAPWMYRCNICGKQEYKPITYL